VGDRCAITIETRCGERWRLGRTGFVWHTTCIAQSEHRDICGHWIIDECTRRRRRSAMACHCQSSAVVMQLVAVKMEWLMALRGQHILTKAGGGWDSWQHNGNNGRCARSPHTAWMGAVSGNLDAAQVPGYYRLEAAAAATQLGSRFGTKYGAVQQQQRHRHSLVRWSTIGQPSQTQVSTKS